MTKKIIAVIITILLILSPAYVYASSLDDLDDRGQTESTAGITWDQINEMSQNSPNSLTPVQGLVLWMFAIIAFLKLAQKMDDLLQKLGLNVTQTGGRALGDLMVAGFALKNMGNVISKGMGAFGFGGGSGGSSSSSGSTGTVGSSAGTNSIGSGPTPIPTGGPRGGAPPAGSTPSGTSPGSRTAPGSVPAGTSPTGRPSTANATSGGSNTTAVNRNPAGRAVEWMRDDGFAQGAIRAGAKGGIIGVGVYGAKAGAAKVGAAVSARFSSDGISSNPQNEGHHLSKNAASGAQSSANPTINTEEFQASRPLYGTEDNTAIPATINNEDYNDVGSISDESAASYDYSSLNDESYNDSGAYDTIIDSQSIPTSIDDSHSVDVDTGTTSLTYADVNDEIWQDTTPQNDLSSTPISATNEESWNDSGTFVEASYSDAVTDSVASAGSAQDTSAIESSDISSHTVDSHVVQSTDSVAADRGSDTVVSGNVNQQDSITVADTVGGSNHIHGAEPAQMPVRNQTIPGEYPQGTAHLGELNDTSLSNVAQGKATSPDFAAQVPIQSGDITVESISDTSTSSAHISSSQPAQMQPIAETIHTDSPVVVQTQVKSEVAPGASAVSRQNTTVQSHTTQVSNVTKNGMFNHPQSGAPSAPQSTTQHNNLPRPAAKGKTKNPSVKGRKRRR